MKIKVENRWSSINLALRLLPYGPTPTTCHDATDAGARLHFGCTAKPLLMSRLITLHAADWANNLGQSHQALEATLGHIG